MKGIEIPFGAKDSELKGWEYTIPEGMEAEIKDGKIVVREKQPEVTEFEIEVHEIISQVLSDKRIPYCREQFEKEAASVLLMKAKKEICKGCTVSIDSYIKGRDDERKEAEKSYTFHYPPYEPPCFHGGICTNPFKDCINCPMHSSGATTNTTSGTCKKD